MKSKKWFIVGSVLALILSLVLLKIIKREIRKQNQAELASILNVKIDEYPFPEDFPFFYYQAVLEKGMTVDEVHEIVKGYDYALNCWGYDEIYYYFGLHHNDSINFMITYDELGKAKWVISGNSDSGPDFPTIYSVENGECTEGLLEK
jgi:hypothetical protein